MNANVRYYLPPPFSNSFSFSLCPLSLSLSLFLFSFPFSVFWLIDFLTLKMRTEAKSDCQLAATTKNMYSTWRQSVQKWMTSQMTRAWINHTGERYSSICYDETMEMIRETVTKQGKKKKKKKTHMEKARGEREKEIKRERKKKRGKKSNGGFH